YVKLRINGLKKEALHTTLGKNQVNTYAIRITKMMSGIEDSHHGPSDAMHNPSQPLKVSQKILVSFLTEIKHVIYRLSHSELVGIKKVAVSSSL
ncbi:hypothetical protein Tco_0056588, partial [Tanacetum coccineum]